MEKKSRKSIIIGIAGLFLVALTLLGLTYAYYRTRIVGNENDTSVSVTSDKLEVKYQNESAVIENAVLEPGGEALTKTFEVANTGNGAATYSVWLEDMTNTFERNQDLTYTLTKNGESVEGTLDHIAAGTHQILIPKVSIDANNTDAYTLTINYVNHEDIDQSDDMGSTLSFKINIREEAVTLETATEGTLMYAIFSNTDTVLENIEDDYGTSYYYTGAVTNNYVNYANMCWRVVRVQGDGTIKLVLADEDNECNSGYSTTDTTSSYIVTAKYDYDGDGIEEFNEYWTSYSDGSSNLNYSEGNLASIIKTWVSTKITGTNAELLTTTSWCNDLSADFYYEYGWDDNWEPVYDKESATNGWRQTKRFGIINRQSENNYTLKCNMKGLDNSKAVRKTSNAEVLTADEVALGGAYLETNAGGFYYEGFGTNITYWTMTPFAEGDDMEYQYNQICTSTGTANDLGPEGTVRPAIVIKNDVLLDSSITGQNGTYTNPYEIG